MSTLSVHMSVTTGMAPIQEEDSVCEGGHVALSSVELEETIKTNDCHTESQGRSTEDSYDTDLECEDEEIQDFALSGQNKYLNTCKSLGIVPVSYFLRHMKDSKLALCHHGLGALGAKALAYPLETNTSVLTLDLQDNWLEGEGGAAVADMLMENCYISDLNLAENKLGSHGAAAICNMLMNNTTIQVLNLSGNGFTDNDAQVFADALCENNRVKYLNLSHNEFGESSGGKIIGASLSENETVEELDLSWNNFRRKSAIELCAGIMANTKLRALNLCMNGISNEASVAVADLLRQNITLQDLDISFNRIGITGALVLAKGLETNDSLLEFKMGNNPITYEGAKAVLKSICVTTSVVVHLDLAAVNVDKEFQSLSKELQESRAVTVVHGKLIGDYVIKGSPKKKGVETIFGVPVSKVTSSTLLSVIKTYCEDNSIRVTECLLSMDKNKDHKLDTLEFVAGLQMAGMELLDSDQDRLDSIFADFEVDTIDFSPLLSMQITK